MKKDNKLYLNNQLCFALYSSTNAIIRSYNKYLSPIGITYTQYLVLMTLWNDKKLTIYEISSKLKLNPSTISPVIKRLALLNYIEKKRNKSDERIVFVKLTNTGENLKKKLTKVQELVSKRTELSEINYHRIKNDLKNLTKNLESENKKAF